MSASKPEQKPKETPALVREYQQRRVRTPVLLTATVGLALALGLIFWLHPSLSRMPNWQRVGRPWLIALAGTAVACGIVWRWRRVSAVEVARELDRQWAAKNRLEAATELSDPKSPLTAAQHAEAEAFFSKTPKPRFRFDLLFLALATILLLAHLGTATVWIEQAPKAKPVLAPVVEAPKASIKWKSPKAEIKATPVEEVPLVAEAASESGLKNLELYVSINGEPAKPTPISVEKLDKAGTLEIKTSLLMDELGVEPYDMVSYYLQADRIYSAKLPPTASSIQFIQVRPFREDALIVPPGGGPKKDAVNLLEMILKVKIAQLLLMKQNFVLAHAEIDRRDAAFREENARVGNDQNLLGDKTDEIKKLAIARGLPTLVIDKLAEAEPLMREASTNILSVKNAEAVPPQGKSLSAITAIEKLLRKIIPPPGDGKPKPPLRDPFGDEQRFKLKPRKETPAGNVELLLEMQSKLVADLKKPTNANSPKEKQPEKNPGEPKPNQSSGQQPAPQPGQQPGDQSGAQPGQGQPGSEPEQQSNGAGKPGETGTLAQREDAIREALAKLTAAPTFDPDINQLIRSAAGHTGVAGQQLEANDNKAALEPASAAQNDLKKAVDLIAQRGREQAKAALADAQAQLNEAAAKEGRLKGQTGSGAAGEQQKLAEDLARLKESLQQEADKQQNTGSAVAAQELAKLASGLSDANLKKNLQALTKDPGNVPASDAVAKKLAELAAQSASGQAGFERDPARALQETIARLESGQASLERLAAKGPGTQGEGTPGSGNGQATRDITDQMKGDLQRAAALANNPSVQSHADEVRKKMEAHYAEWTEANLVLPLKEISGPMRELIAMLKQSLTEVSRQELLRQADLDEAPLMYRDAVSNYLESLSLDYVKPEDKPAPVKPAEPGAR